jgi:ubiquinone biosynthesis protein
MAAQNSSARADHRPANGLGELDRLQQIVGVLLRHGFEDLVRRLGGAHLLAAAGRAAHRNGISLQARLAPPARLRCALEELGPAFVKLGQLLAGRVDLLGPEWIAELEKLHNHVPAVPFEQLKPQLVSCLGGDPHEVFAWFDEQPLAAASIAQVHRARLHDGQEVVVKIRRPGVSETIGADVRLLERIAASAVRHWPELEPYRPVELVREFARSLARELDFTQECRNAERIAGHFAGHPEVVIPKVIWTWTHEGVNVQEWIDGTPGADLARVDEAGLDRQELARKGAALVMKMVITDGFFHADPHPGNVIYLPGNRIALIDFGMVGKLSERRRSELLDLLLGLVKRDAESVVEVLLDWTGGGRVSVATLAADIDNFLDAYHGVPLAELNLGRLLLDVTSVLRAHRLMLPADLALLIKVFITLEGLGRGLDPTFHMAQEALPLLRTAVRARYRPAALWEQAWRSVQRSARVLGGLPDDLVRMVRAVRRSGVQVHVDVHGLQQSVDQLDAAVSRLTVGLVVAALIIGSSIVMTVDAGPRLFGLPAFGLMGFSVAVLGALWLLRSISRGGRHR